MNLDKNENQREADLLRFRRLPPVTYCAQTPL